MNLTLDSADRIQSTPGPGDLVFVDIETTGIRFGFHEIIEIAAIRTSADASLVLDEIESKLAPMHPERITPEAKQINGFDERTWAMAHCSDLEFWNRMAEFWRGCTPVCHNPSFERAFISLAAGVHDVHDLGVDYHWIGTESLAWPLFKSGSLSRVSLDALCNYFGLAKEPSPHRAIGGARACQLVYRALMDRARSQ